MSSSVPEGWGVTPLGDMCRVKGGKRLPKGSAFSETITPFPYIRVADFQSGSIETRGIKYVSTNVREQIKRYTISSSDIYISIAGSIGLVGVVPQIFNGALLTENAAKIVLNDVYLDRTYLCLFLSSEIAQSQFKQEIGTGGGVPKLALFRIEQTVLSVPPLSEQKKIASILTSVDEVIENTQKQIDKLQDLKKATMNELLTKGIGHTEFKDSELGRIPKRWEVLKLNELCSPTSPITYGVLKPGNYVDGGIPLLQVKDLKDGSVDNSGIHRISTSLDAEYARSRVRFHDILISLIGTVGRVSLMPKVTETYNIHRNIGRIRLENPEWVFLHLQSQIGVQQIQLASSGSSQSALNLSALKEFPVPIPPLKEQSDIVSIISSLSDAITTNYRKLRLTQSLKKSLMQDLLTGKVRVTVN